LLDKVIETKIIEIFTEMEETMSKELIEKMWLIS
jgi:hypothetical protein